MASRIGALTGTMIGVAALAGLLAFEAARAARTHQAATERVLADYADLGAEGVATRLQAQLAGRLFPILGAGGSAPPPTRARLTMGLGGGAAELAAAVSWTAWLDSSGSVASAQYDPAVVPPAALADLIRRAARDLPEAAYFGLVSRPGQVLVFGAPGEGAPGVPVFALPNDMVAALLQRAVARDPVLPASLTRGKELGDQVAVVILMDGVVLARRGGAGIAGFHAARSLGPVFGGMTVNVALAESLAPVLLIGGLPRSRLPFLAGVLGLTLALAMTGLIQLRREGRLTRLREEFVAGASHELRTPLAQIRLFAETLRLGRVRDEAERDRALAVVEREARRLEHLVENLLHFSRSERGALRVTPEAVDLGALTREILEDFRPLAEKAGVGLQVDGTDAVAARVDPAAWRQIVLNLLDNAVKYGGRGTAIAARLRVTAGGAEFIVADQGPGVAPGDEHRVWERFWRSAAARREGIAGTGIGLATVRDLVALHGGACHVESNQPRGARFVVRLPGGA